MSIRTKDFLLFIESEVLPERKKRLEDNRTALLKYVESYKNLPFYKRWFTWEPSYKYNIEWDEYKLEIAESLYNKILYRAKCGIEMSNEDGWGEWFYEWANDNGVPY